MAPIRIAVAGCGIAAQRLHFPNLLRLANQFRVDAVCDISQPALGQALKVFPGAAGFTSLTELLEFDCDGLLLLTSGDHVAELLAAAKARRHVLVEKPAGFCSADARAVAQAYTGTGCVAMVGYMKRFDSGTERALRYLRSAGKAMFTQVRLWHPPLDRYISPEIVPTVEELGSRAFIGWLLTATGETYAAQITKAVGKQATAPARVAYFLLITSGIHNLNLLRSALGSRAEILEALCWDGGLAGQVTLGFPDSQVATYAWLFRQHGSFQDTVEFITPAERIIVNYPAAYLRDRSAHVTREFDTRGGVPIVEVEEPSFDDPFRRELLHFHDCIRGLVPPRTTLDDAYGDIELIESIVREMKVRN